MIGAEGAQAVMIGSIVPATASRNSARRLKGRFDLDLLSGFISYPFVHRANLWHCRAMLASGFWRAALCFLSEEAGRKAPNLYASYRSSGRSA